MKQAEISEIEQDPHRIIDELENAYVYADKYGTPRFDQHLRGMQILNTVKMHGKIPIGMVDAGNGYSILHQIGDDAEDRHALLDMSTFHTIGFNGSMDDDRGRKFAFEKTHESMPEGYRTAEIWVAHGTAPEGRSHDISYSMDLKVMPIPKGDGKYAGVEYDEDFNPTDIEYSERAKRVSRKAFWYGYEQEMATRKRLGKDWLDDTDEAALEIGRRAADAYLCFRKWINQETGRSDFDPRWGKWLEEERIRRIEQFKRLLETKEAQRDTASLLKTSARDANLE